MKYYLCCVLIILGFTAYPQSNKIYIDFSSGLSLPMGEFGNQNLNEGSFAELGGNAVFNISWLAKAPFGLRASISGNMNPVDVTSLGWYKVNADPFLQDVSIRSDPFMAYTMTGGVFYEKRLMNKLNVMGGINAGVMRVNTPYQLYKPQYFLYGPEYFEITSAADYAFTYNLSIDLEYEIRNSWSLIFHSSYHHSVANFTFWTANEVRVDKKPISYLLANLGFRLKL